MSFEICPSDENTTSEYQLEISKVSDKLFSPIRRIVFRQVGELILVRFLFILVCHLDWREFSKTSRTNICDLRFEDILQKIWTEKDGISTSRSIDGNGTLFRFVF